MGERIERKTFEVPTPDGRWLAAEIAGPEDGELVVFHAGTPSTCLLYEGMVRECTKRGLRIVCASRPGYDGAPPLPGRSYADNPTDTMALLDFLEVEKAYVVGHSGGGAPALADAALIPSRVKLAAAVATFAPRYEMGSGWSEGLEANELEITAHDEGEPRLREELEAAACEMAKARSGEEITAHPDLPKYYSSVDRACFKGDFLDFVLEARWRAPDGIDGWVDDDFALFGHWGFNLDAIRVPVSIWQGGQDKLVPVAHARWLAEHVPGARLHLLEKEGHVSLLNHRFGEILQDLTDLAR